MTGDSRGKAIGWRIVLFGWGCGSLLFDLVHSLGQEDSIGEFVAGYGIPVLLSASVIAGAIWLHRRRLTTADAWRIALWVGGGIVVMIGFEFTTLVYQRIEGATVVEPWFTLMHSGTQGALVGLLLGENNRRVRLRERDLRTEQERSTQLGQQLLVLHRVFRHDIRTAVNVIRGHAGLLADRVTDVESSTATIARRATELERLSEKAGVIERLVELDPEGRRPIALTPALEAARANVRTANPDADISIDASDDVYVYANTSIQFAIEEVVENAVVHNESDTPVVAIEVETEADARANETLVRVVDDGPGIPEGERDVFEQGEETPLEHASGIGLWFAIWIVDEAGGTLSFSENDERGTTVSLRLPTAPTAS